MEDRRDRAHRLARAAVDALVRMDVPLADAVVDAVDGTLVDAPSVVHIHAGLRDHVRHRRLLRITDDDASDVTTSGTVTISQPPAKATSAPRSLARN